MSVTVRLEDDLDISRGDVICGADAAPPPARDLVADVCWMADAALRPRGRYAIKSTTRSARAIVEAVEHRVEIDTLRHDTAASDLGLNDIGRVRLRTSEPLVVDPYDRNRATGSFILIDEASNDTVGAGMVVSAAS
jgi:bifunctional enzyme CysN/CysC